MSRHPHICSVVGGRGEAHADLARERAIGRHRSLKPAWHADMKEARLGVRFVSPRQSALEPMMECEADGRAELDRAASHSHSGPEREAVDRVRSGYWFRMGQPAIQGWARYRAHASSLLLTARLHESR